MIDFSARWAHYLDHLAPIWHAIPAERRGRFLTPPDLLEHARARGVEATPYAGDVPPWGPGGPIVVAAVQDERRARAAGRPVVFCSHGCGQAFNAADGTMDRSYSGGPGREGVSLFLAVNDYQAARWRRGYPRTPVEVVGCPRLDAHPPETGRREGPVAVAFHWPGRRFPETGTAFAEYHGGLRALARRFDLIGHVHPRAVSAMLPAFRRAGIPYVADLDEVLERASVLVNDCSSVLYEFAAVGGPVVVLNATTFRRHVHHGLRFWEYADVGVQCDHPRDIVGAITAALEDPPAVAARRREIVRQVFPHHGHAAARAAAAVLGMG